jgi:GLPGLI family protein
MIYIIFIILIFSTGSTNYFQVTYNEKVNLSTTELKSFSSDVKNSIENTKRYYVLQTNGNQSIFYKDTTIHSGNIAFNSSKVMDLVYFKNFDTKSMALYDKLTPNCVAGTKSPLLASDDWTVTNETKQIGQYKTRKATIQLNDVLYTAYFTDEISLYDGPKNFCGLPGLIIRLESGNTVLEMVKIEKLPSTFALRIPEIHQWLSEKAFEKYKKEKLAGISK